MTSGTQAAARKAGSSPWPERLARFGLAARGVLYIVVGVLAVQVAFGQSQEEASQTGALQEVASKPGGQVLIWILAVGMVGYALWRLATAAFGPVADPMATDAKERVKALAEGIGYGVVAVLAIRIAASGDSSGGSSSGGGSGGSEQTATALSWPGGQFLVGAIGVVIVGVGLYFIYEGWKAKFTDELKLGTVGPTARTAVVQLGRVGRIARGIAFVVIGVLVVAAAVTYDADKASGMDGALKTLAGQPYGKWVLVFVALGLVAYGLYGLAESKLRKVS